MPKARKPRQEAEVSANEEAEGRSQLEQIRAALSSPPRSGADDEPAGLPAPDEPLELPAPTAEEAAEAPVAVQDPPQPPPAISPWVPPPTSPPPGARPSPPRARGGSSSLAVGIVFVVVGVFFLLIRLLDIDLSSYGWPLYVIIPGLTLLVVGFISLGSGALIPGGIVTVTGLVVAYQAVTNDWASWSYAWALVLPGGVGLGIFLQGVRVRNTSLTRQGRTLMFWAVLIFLIGFVFFESVLHVSGHDYGKVGEAALPVLLIVIGVTLLVRNFQRERRA